MEKFLFYSAGTSPDDMVCVPAYRVTNILVLSDTTMAIRHRLPDNSTVGSDVRYEVGLTINSGTGKKVSDTISNAINSGKNPFIVIADDTNKVYIDGDITAVGTLTVIS